MAQERNDLSHQTIIRLLGIVEADCTKVCAVHADLIAPVPASSVRSNYSEFDDDAIRRPR